MITTKSISKLSYKDQLKTSAWLRKKYEILERDNFVCIICMCDNYERQLEVHHTIYLPDRKAWEYSDLYLVTLCRDCHQSEHDHNNTEKLSKVTEWFIKLFMNK